jgi:small subunit ribosomal protein S9
MPTKTTKPKTKKSKPVKEKVAVIKVVKTKKEEKVIDVPRETDVVIEQEATVKPVSSEKYYEAIGRRKESTARVRVYTKKSTDNQPAEDKAILSVNGKSYQDYFRSIPLQNIVESPLKKLKSLNRFKATAKVLGGGIHGQADAIRLGLSRALVLFDINFSKKLRKAGFLTRDSRAKERRKYGLKKARKAPQWAKR